MKSHSSTLVIPFTLLVLVFLPGCASVINGTTQDIPVATDPAGARVSADGNFVGTSPVKVNLRRKEDHVITMDLDGYQTESISVTGHVGGAVWGNILAGGIIGWGVDATNGSQYNLEPETINVKLRPVVPAANPTASVAPQPTVSKQTAPLADSSTTTPSAVPGK